MAITIKEIANLAGVSRGTVDKALHNRPGIGNETRQKVLEIAKALNYQPNLIGRVLVNSRKQVRVGVILTPLYNPFVNQVIEGIKAAESEFADYNCEVIIKTPITLEPQEYSWILDELENEKVSGIVALPIEDQSFVQHINQLSNQGIEVVTFNSYVKNINQFCYVGQNHYKGGRTAAGLMGKLVQKDANIAAIISSKYLSCHTDRLAGFKEKLGELNNNIALVEVRENQDMQDLAFKHTMEYIKKYPNLKGLYLTGGGVLGAAKAIEMLGKGKEVSVVCYDLLPEIKELVQREIIDFVIDQNAFSQGYQSVKIMMEKLLRSKSPQSDYLQLPINIANSDTIE